MIITINTIRLPEPITRAEALRIFLSTAARYRSAPGLLRKHYVFSEDGSTVGGIYVWQSRQQAEALFTDAWRDFVRDKYGAEPELSYLDCPVVVDNLLQKIVTDEPGATT